MAELRQDIVTGQWVVVATGRAVRPSAFERRGSAPPVVDSGDCPFCPGHETMTPPELLAVRPGGGKPDSPGWRVRVVPNMFPAFGSGRPAAATTTFFPRMAAEGTHEVIIHTPRHDLSLATMSAEEVGVVMSVYRRRYLANADDPHVRYVHIIVNHGRESGASLAHSHSQVFGAPLVPPLVRQELEGASRFDAANSGCVFCRMVSEELARGERLIAQNGSFLVVAPFASRLPFEAWVIPRSHRESFGLSSDEELRDLAKILKDMLCRYRDRLGDPSYNCYIHSAPCDGSGYPYYHWHLEAVPRLTIPGSFELGTSMWINITTPEQAAAYLTGPPTAGPVEEV